MDTIINSKSSFIETIEFIKRHFKNVRVVESLNSHLAELSQNYHKIILFENRNSIFSIKWNYYNSTLCLGDITKNEKISLQYVFTKMEIDDCYPIEIGNNKNVVFWQYEVVHQHDEMNSVISPLRLPVS